MQQRLKRDTLQKKIVDLIGSCIDDTKAVFEPNRSDANTPALLRIPEHQRFYVWPESKKSLLVDSIMNNCPLPLMVFTEQPVNGETIWFVQDGQQRLITLQKFIMGEFLWNKKRYDELTMTDRLHFLGYTVTCEIIKNPTVDQIADIFERLNCGKPLTDNDKFWNRKDSAVVSFTLNELMRHEDLREHFRKYVGPVGSGKSRGQLSDIVGAVIAITTRSIDCISTSFDKIGSYVCNTISDEDKERVIEVFREYFTIITLSLRKHAVPKPRKLYIKLAGMLGIYLYWRMPLPDSLKAVKDETMLAAIRNPIKCWGWFAWNMQDKNFKKTYFESLSAGSQRNITREALRERTEYLLREFQNQDAASIIVDSDSIISCAEVVCCESSVNESSDSDDDDDDM